jgi:hypothetical protein
MLGTVDNRTKEMESFGLYESTYQGDDKDVKRIEEDDDEAIAEESSRLFLLLPSHLFIVRIARHGTLRRMVV